MTPIGASNLIDLLRRRSADTPDRTVFTFLRDGVTPVETVTFADLDRRARFLTAHFYISKTDIATGRWRKGATGHFSDLFA